MQIDGNTYTVYAKCRISPRATRVRKENDMGVFERTNYESIMQELSRIFGADDRVTGMIPDTYDDPSGTVSYGGQYFNQLGPVVARQFPLVNGLAKFGRSMRFPTDLSGPSRDARDGFAADLVNDFTRGISLAEDSTAFPDRQIRLADGTIGSEERIRDYKAEGLQELIRGAGYGAANIPDSVLGLVVDEDSPLRAPTQGIKRSLAYEPTGDEAVDSALSAVHTMGSIAGETVGTGGSTKVITGLANQGLRSLAPYVPRMVNMPEAVQGMMSNSARNMMGRVPHIEDVLKTKLGSDILNFVSEGIVDVATIHQIAKEENWGSEELENALEMAAALAVGGEFLRGLPTTKDWTLPTSMQYPKKPPEVVDPESINPYIARLKGDEKGIVRDDMYNHPQYILPKPYFDKKTNKQLPGPPPPHQIGKGIDPKTGKPRKSKARLEEENADRQKRVRNIHNEELDVYLPQSLLPWEKKSYIKKHGEIGPIPNDPELSPDDSLILGQELRRVFGKRAQVDEVDKNKFHITLPNGIELSAQTERDIVMPSTKSAAIRKQYDLPNRTKFKLKGHLDQVDSEALIRLSSLHDVDTVQHEAVHFALDTVTTRKEKQMLEELFGTNEEKQVAGIMQAIAEERAAQAEHPVPLLRTVLRKIENLGGYVKSFAENVPMAIAKRNLSYLEGRPPKDILRDYAESFVDGSVWGRDVAPVMRELLDRNREEIMDAITKNHSRYFNERDRLVLSLRSPNIMSLLPYDNAPLLIDNSILNKVLLEKHGKQVSPEHLARLSEELEQPMIIIRGGWRPRGDTDKERAAYREKHKDTYNFILGMEDNNKTNLIVPIGFNYDISKNNKEKVNKVKSMYGYGTSKDKEHYRTNIHEIMEMVRHKDLVYVDKDKVLEAVRRHRPEEFERIRDYLDKKLPPHVHTVESYREYRKRRGMKPIRESRN